MQAANIEAEASGIHDGGYQLTKHEFSGLGRGKYSGMYHMYIPLMLSFLYTQLLICIKFSLWLVVEKKKLVIVG